MCKAPGHEGYFCRCRLLQLCVTPDKTTSELSRQIKAGRVIDGAKAGAEAPWESFVSAAHPPWAHRHCR